MKGLRRQGDIEAIYCGFHRQLLHRFLPKLSADRPSKTDEKQRPPSNRHGDGYSIRVRKAAALYDALIENFCRIQPLKSVREDAALPNRAPRGSLMRMSSAFRYSVGERISYSSCSGFHSTFLSPSCSSTGDQ
jgi:hypothetical protein